LKRTFDSPFVETITEERLSQQKKERERWSCTRRSATGRGGGPPKGLVKEEHARGVWKDWRPRNLGNTPASGRRSWPVNSLRLKEEGRLGFLGKKSREQARGVEQKEDWRSRKAPGVGGEGECHEKGGGVHPGEYEVGLQVWGA